MNPPELRCHSCGAPQPRLVAGLESLKRVTSDCKPWPAGGRLASCGRCGLVQSVLDVAWHEGAEAIYRDYTIYHTSKGAEQSVFDPRSGQATARSQRIAQRLAAAVALPPRGRMLDVGCGNGAFLRAFHEGFPGWSLVGAEVNDRNRAAIEAVLGVESLFVGDALEVPSTFACVSLIHVLEHIPGPLEFLRRLRDKLEPGGLLLVEVPDCEANPFMFLVADHASHFFLPVLRALVEAAGFEVVVGANDWVAKELTVVARKAGSPAATAPRAPDFADAVARRLDWLARIAADAKQNTGRADSGLFGTSIAATWLLAELDGRVAFFVDEDPHRAGARHFGHPVLSPSQVGADAEVLLALPPGLAASIAARLAHLPVRWRVPEPWEA
jgi:SAM-dependent methyltransferase